jgi:flagellar biosynthesis protein FlhF
VQMQTRTFQAGNMAEALQLVKTELGPDAMIISSRKERRKGLLGLFMKPVFRITAAYDPAPPRRTMSFREEPEPGETARDEFRNAMLAPLARELKELRERVDALAIGDAPQRTSAPVTAPVAAMPAGSLPGVAAGFEREFPADQLQDMKKMLLDSIQAQPSAASAAIVPAESAITGSPLAEVSSALHEAGVGETAIRALVEKVKAAKHQPGTEPALKEKLKAAVETTIKCSGAVRLKKNSRKIVALVGPTGVGKTTTVAKLAAAYTVTRKARIALITIDTFRVGAVEQLKTYSRIMGVPLEVASTPKELEKAVAAHEDKDLILIDTVGRSPRDHETIENLRTMLCTDLPIEIHLCVAATTRERELNAIVDSFGVLPISRLLFTKLDESSTFGSIVNLQIERKLPLSYFTKGQRVPEDIEPAHGKKVAELILGEG